MKRRSIPHAPVEAALESDLRDHAGLRQLVEAASAPAQPHELSGLEVAMAAFSSAQSKVGESHRPARTFASRMPASALAVKIMLACLGAAALGGLTYAGVNGKLPGTTPHTPASSHQSATTTAQRSSPATPPGHATGSKPATGSTIAPDEALPGLCTSWLASSHDPNRATDHRFVKLINAAGSAEAVTSYCAALAHPASRGNTSHPNSESHPTPSPHSATHSPKRPKVSPPKASPTHSGH